MQFLWKFQPNKPNSINQHSFNFRSEMLKGDTNAATQSGSVTARPAVKFASSTTANSTNKTVSPKEKKNASIGKRQQHVQLKHLL